MAIRICNLVCPNAHIFFGIAYDDTHETRENAIDYMEAAFKEKPQARYCGLCGSRELTYEDRPSDYKTIEEAKPELLKQSAEQVDMRAGADAFGMSFDERQRLASMSRRERITAIAMSLFDRVEAMEMMNQAGETNMEASVKINEWFFGHSSMSRTIRLYVERTIKAMLKDMRHFPEEQDFQIAIGMLQSGIKGIAAPSLGVEQFKPLLIGLKLRGVDRVFRQGPLLTYGRLP